MGKRTRARQRALGLRKQPQETKKDQARRTLAQLQQMDEEVQRVVQGP